MITTSEIADYPTQYLLLWREVLLNVARLEDESGDPQSQWGPRLDMADRISDVLEIRAGCWYRRDRPWSCTRARMTGGERAVTRREGCFFPECVTPCQDPGVGRHMNPGLEWGRKATDKNAKKNRGK